MNCIGIFFFNNHHVLAEDAFLDVGSTFYQLPLAMLYSLLPVPFVASTVCPVHFSVAMPQVFKIMAFVDVASGPAEYPVPTLLIVDVLPLVLVTFARSLLPHSMSMPQTILKVPFEEGLVGPGIFPITIGLSVDIVADVFVAVCEFFYSFSMLEAGFELSFVLVSVDPRVNTITVGHSELPFADVRVTPRTCPHARPMLLSVYPHSLVDFVVGPSERSEPLWLAINEAASVLRAVRKSFVTFAMLGSALPFSFINSSGLIEHDTQALPLIVHDLAEVIASFVALYFYVFRLAQPFDVEFRLRLVLIEPLDELLRSFGFVCGFGQLSA